MMVVWPIAGVAGAGGSTHDSAPGQTAVANAMNAQSSGEINEWADAPAALQADTDAATLVVETETAFGDEEEVAVFETGDKVPLAYGEEIDTTQFAGEDAQLVIGHIDEEADLEGIDGIEEFLEVDDVEFMDGDLSHIDDEIPSDGKFEATFDADTSGQYVAMVATTEDGHDGIVIEDGAVDTVDGDVEIVGTEEVAALTPREALGLLIPDQVDVWDRAPLPLRADPGNAATVVDNQPLFINPPDTSEDVDANRGELAVFDKETDVTLTYRSASGVPTYDFAGEDAQLVVAKFDEADEAPESVDDALDMLVEGSVSNNVDFQTADLSHIDDEIPSDGEFDASIQTDGPGQYAALLVTNEEGHDGIVIEDGDVTGIDGEVTAIGVEHIAVQQTSSTVEIGETQADLLPIGQTRDFISTAELETDEPINHAIVVYNEETFTGTITTIDIREDPRSSDFDHETDIVVESGISSVNGVVEVRNSPTLMGTSLEDRRTTGPVTISDAVAVFTEEFDVDDEDGEMIDASVVAIGDGDETEELEVEALEDWTKGEYRWVHVASTEASDEFATSTGTVTVQETHELTVTVTDKAGNPIEGATVTVENTGKTLETDANGEALFHVTDGDVDLTIDKDGYATVEETVKDVTEDTSHTVTLQKTHELTVTVVDDDGDALKDATVTVEDTGKEVITDANGEALFYVTEGEVTLSAEKDGYDSASDTVTITGDTTVTMVLSADDEDDDDDDTAPGGGGGSIGPPPIHSSATVLDDGSIEIVIRNARAGESSYTMLPEVTSGPLTLQNLQTTFSADNARVELRLMPNENPPADAPELTEEEPVTYLSIEERSTPAVASLDLSALVDEDALPGDATSEHLVAYQYQDGEWTSLDVTQGSITVHADEPGMIAVAAGQPDDDTTPTPTPTPTTPTPTPTVTDTPTPTETPEDPDPDEASSLWLWILIAFILIAIAGGGYYYYEEYYDGEFDLDFKR